jgi:hypothetical protein
MAVEIKEVVIRAVISQENEWSGKDVQPPRASHDKAAIVQACVQEVMKILKRAKER